MCLILAKTLFSKLSFINIVCCALKSMTKNLCVCVVYVETLGTLCQLPGDTQPPNLHFQHP